jgi:hypothetical protein
MEKSSSGRVLVVESDDALRLASSAGLAMPDTTFPPITAKE